MASSPSAANNGGSFSSTASSTSTSANDHDHSDVDKDAAVIKQEPTVSEAQRPTDSYEPSVWAHIFDENGIITLDMEDDDPMEEVDLVSDPRRALETITGSGGGAFGAAGFGGGLSSSAMGRDNAARGDTYFPHHTNAQYEPTPASALLDNWGYYNDVDMTSPSHIHDDLTSRFGAARPMTMGPLSLKTEPQARGFGSDFGATFHGTQPQPRAPSAVFTFEKQSNGKPFSLSKPIIRDDGLVLVGTELSSGSPSGHASNRIFITDTRSFDPSRPTHTIHTQAEVRDLQWLSQTAAIAAIGCEIQVVETGVKAGTPTWSSARLLPPIRTVHGDSIRELAVNRMASNRSVTVASAGFDEAIVVTTLGENGDPATATTTAKIDAFDVVSSLRWHPHEPSRLSWTTDGGDFQVSDIRARATPQLQVALNSLMIIEQMGGLFTHEHISPSNVVLGFEMGQLLFLDLRMPRKDCCYGAMTSPSAPIPIGEMRCSKDGSCAIFGVGGFATATVSETGRELENLLQAGSAPSQVGFHGYKTSGAFSDGTNSLLAVSDSMGVVSIYNDNKVRRGSFPVDRPTASSHGGWTERDV